MVTPPDNTTVSPSLVAELVKHKRLTLAQLEKFLNRYFWLLPVVGFTLGWASFVLVHRGEDLARGAALLALLGWPWILAEPILVPYLVGRKNPILSSMVSNFFSQTIQQELLFFTLPFLIAATHLDDVGQLTFTLSVIAAAIISTIDPMYNRFIHKHRLANLAFHALCCFVTALVILPIVVKLPTDKTLLFALAFVVVWLCFVLPGVLRSLNNWKARLIAILVMCALPFCIWMTRASIPATGILVTRAGISTHIVANEPVNIITTLTVAELSAGVYAYAAVRAPNGLTQRIIFSWQHDGWTEEIPAIIEGGRAEGFRTYSKKSNFTDEATGLWTVDILTYQGQLLSHLTFIVTL